MKASTFSVQQLFEIGARQSLTSKQRQKVRLCNKLAFLEGSIAFCYAIFSMLLYPTLTIYPIIALLVVTGVYVLHAHGYLLLPRISLSLLFPLLCTTYHALLVSEGETMLIGLYILAFVFSIVPFLLFDANEIKHLWFVLLPNALLLIFFKKIAWVLESNPPLDSGIFRIPAVETASLVMALIGFIASLLVLLYANKTAEDKLLRALHEHEEKHEELEKAQQTADENLRALESSRKTEQEEQWLQQQLNKLSEEARGANSPDELLKRSIKRLVLESDASLGAFFAPISQEQDADLAIKATFAYDRHKYLQKTVPVGDGLVGQGWLEKEPILLYDVPDDYVKIGSGLGKIPPKAVVIAPLVYQNQAVAVLELASLKEISPIKFKFVVKSCEQLAGLMSDLEQKEKLKKALSKLSEQE